MSRAGLYFQIGERVAFWVLGVLGLNRLGKPPPLSSRLSLYTLRWADGSHLRLFFSFYTRSPGRFFFFWNALEIVCRYSVYPRISHMRKEGKEGTIEM